MSMDKRRNAFIQGNRIYLRSLELTDLDGNYQYWLNDSDVTKHMIKGSFPTTRAQLQSYYEQVVSSSQNLVLAIVSSETDEHIGNVGLHDINLQHQTAEFGICLGEKAYWRKGLGQVAAALICQHGFLQLNLQRIELGVIGSHNAALRSYEAVGFKSEGVRRACIFKNGIFEDVVMMGMLKDELNLNILSN